MSTPFGKYVIQHINPRLFDGFELRDGVAIATPEKALFDTIYLLAARGRRHLHLPEIEIPQRFDQRELAMWTSRIVLRRLRSLVRERLDLIFKATVSRRGRAATTARTSKKRRKKR
ncbi:MAG: hypothetical protein ACRDFT_10590 [bacterium]